MPSTKIDVFFEQFPFARNHAGGDRVARVFVSRIEPSLLSYERAQATHKAKHYDTFTGEYTTDYWVTEKLFLLDEKGKVLVRRTESRCEYRKYIFWGPTIVETSHSKETIGHVGGTVSETLKEMTVAEQESVQYVLSYWEETRTMILYKVPKGYTLPQWIAMETERERLLLEQECITLDAVEQ